MKITAVIKKTFDTGKVRAIADVTLDGAFAIHGLKLIEGDKGMKSDSLLYAGTHSTSRYASRDKTPGGGAVDDKIGCGAERRTLHSPATQ